MDLAITELATCKFEDILPLCEGRKPDSWLPHQPVYGNERLAARMYLESVFYQDVYMINLLLERLDGQVTTDTQMDSYQYLFSDELNRLLALDTEDKRLQPQIEDNCLTLLAKALLNKAMEDIYHNKDGERIDARPDAKRERAQALKMVLERSGGKKSRQVIVETPSEVSVQDWIVNALPESDEV